MPPVLRALPYFPHPTAIDFEAHGQRHRVDVMAYQIVVWVGIAPVGELHPAAGAPRFPAILDTGHTHNFAIRPTQLRDWTGIDWPRLPPEGHESRYQGVAVPHRRANVWLYPNQHGWRDWVDPNPPPALLELHRGLAVYGDGVWLGTTGSERLTGPRLPLIGLRAISNSRAQFRVDAAQRSVWLDVP